MSGKRLTSASSGDSVKRTKKVKTESTPGEESHTCDVCKDGSRVEATGYCRQCQQFLCQRCCEQHKNISGVRYHKVEHLSELRNTKVQRSLYEGKLVPIWSYNVPTIVNQTINYSDIAYLQIDNITVDVVLVELSRSGKSQLKAFDNTGTEVFHVNFNFKICSIVQSLSKEKVYLSVPMEKTVVIYKLSVANAIPNFTLESSFKTCGGQCFGMTTFNDGLAVLMKFDSRTTGQGSAVIPDWQLQFLSYDGKVKQRICYDSEDKPLFSNPKHITSNNEQTVLFISESSFTGYSCVIVIGRNGDVLHRIEEDVNDEVHKDLHYPSTLAVDGENNIYVICHNKIVQIHKDWTKSRVLFERSIYTELNLGFNKVNSTLIVAENNHKDVICYNLG